MVRHLLLACFTMTTVCLVISQGQQGLTQCQTTFIQNLNKCVAESQIVFNQFLHLVTNGTNGDAPENPVSFKLEACSNQEAMVRCGVEFMRGMINSTMCNSQEMDQRPFIDRQFRSLFGSLDEKCAHPCRRTLALDLRNCYVEASLDADLFLSNSTMARGAVIGTTTEQARTFCKHKDHLVSCMKQRRDDCPEAPMILRAIGLDIDSMEKGVQVLCTHQDIYLSGVDCFAEPTDSVVSCQQTMSQKTVRLMMTSQKQKLPEDQFFNQFCDVRLEHVNCDLDAWKMKDHRSCSEAVIGLRTELECGLLPDECSATHRQVIDEVCHKQNFKREHRPTPIAASSSVIRLSGAIWNLLLSLACQSLYLSISYFICL